MRRFCASLAILAVALPAAAAPVGPATPPAATSALQPVHSCHHEPFFDENGRLHAHLDPHCRATAVRLYPAQRCAAVARWCARDCELAGTRASCVRRCYRRNTPRYC